MNAQSDSRMPVRLHGDAGPPVVTERSRTSSWLRRNTSTVVLAVGLLAGGLGAYLAATPSPVSVFSDVSGYHVGGLNLRSLPCTEAGASLCYDGAVSIAEVQTGAGAIHAVGVMRYGGATTTGDCLLTGNNEHCTFTGAGTLTADDVIEVLPGHGLWHRRYSDGQTVTMDLPGQLPVPVPIPVGR